MFWIFLTLIQLVIILSKRRKKRMSPWISPVIIVARYDIGRKIARIILQV